MRLFSLEARVPLTKRYSRDKTGNLIKTPYPMTWEFTSHEHHVTTLAELETVVRNQAKLGRCLIKGLLNRPLVTESRAGATSTNDPTEWICLDFDGLPEDVEIADKRSGKAVKTPLTLDLILNLLGLGDVSYIVQWSASYGIVDKRIRCHVFMLLDKAYTAPLLKQWLIQLNHEVAALRNAMTLTKTGNSLHWPLDISACQNDKLIYVAKPELDGIPDPMGRDPRIKLVTRKHECFVLPSAVNSVTKNRELTIKRTDELRGETGLPKRKTVFKMVGPVEVLAKPDSCTVTEMKQERGFTYFNLNGGDSWAYYHPDTNPDFIYNFKGEPVYLTKELLPDYWEEITSAGTRTSSQGLLHLAFCDRKTSGYYRGTYDTTTDTLELFPAKNETQVRHFAKQVGMPLGDFIPEWDLVFAPHSDVRVDPQTKVVNLFTPSVYMRNKPKPVKNIPPTVYKVIFNAVGSDQATYDHFMNWLAFILQFREQTKTAWILHGTTGTGKGVMINHILRPLFGEPQVAMRRMEELNEPYNHYMRNALIVFVDEVQTKALNNERGAMARLKNFITEPVITIRQMYANGHEADNYTNWIFASNKPDPVAIDKEDRRFNVGKYQKNKLKITAFEIDQIDKELQNFHDWLMNYPCNQDAARAVLHTADRETMISVSESSVDSVASALLEGDMDFFIDHLPTDNSYESARDKRYERVEEYKAVLKRLLDRTDLATGKCNLGREELRTLFDYCCGNMPDSPNKFTSLLKHHRIHVVPLWVDNKTVRGLPITWVQLKKWQQFRDVLTPPARPIKRVK